MEMSALHFLNGQWVSAEDLKLSAFDLSVARGYGIFEQFRTYNKRLFRVNDHLDRLKRSAELLGLTLPIPRGEIKALAEEGLTKNDYPETTVRTIVTGGVSEDLITPGKPSLIMIFKPVKTPAPEVYTNGVKVITWPNRRFTPEAKTLSYSDAVMAMKKAQNEGVFEALYTDPVSGEILEGTASNAFFVKDGALFTAPGGVLRGVTRKIVMELAEKLSIKYYEQRTTIADLSSVEEVFITATSKQVVPVVQVDDIVIADGKVGPISRRLKQAFEELAAQN
jgi:branched-chain amino acid aminotransferase